MYIAIVRGRPNKSYSPDPNEFEFCLQSFNQLKTKLRAIIQYKMKREEKDSRNDEINGLLSSRRN